ncbi:MAG: ATP-binding protein [Syntrophomonadaceae bacterium]|nr:ATP-binding protein [Syntrophomonadaceae bacterium]
MKNDAYRRFISMNGLFWAIATVLLIAVALSCFMFAYSYQSLRQAIQRERIDYVEEISAQIINSQQFMEQEYSIQVQTYARILNNRKPESLEEARQSLSGQVSPEILLISTGGRIINLSGEAVVLSDRLFMQDIYNNLDVVKLFTSLNYKTDSWLFATPIEPISIAGTEYENVAVAVDAEMFRDNLAISLFDHRGASYIIDNDGSTVIKPLKTNIAFDGYNLFASMSEMGAKKEDVARLKLSIADNDSGNFLIDIDRQEWLISYQHINRKNSIVVAIPLTVTAAQTYNGLNKTIIFAATTVILVGLIALVIFLRLSYRDKERARQALAVAAKNDFFSKMSHDMRTPLNAIIGLQILANESDDIDIIKDYLGKSSSAADYLLNIINDILDIDRIESGKIIIADQSFNMNQLLSDIKSFITEIATEKSLAFATEIDDRFETNYIGDPVRIKQILVNLLNNAVKFTKPYGRISLKAFHNAKDEICDEVTLIVSDAGIGMSEEYMTRIFRPFEQESSSYTQQYAGSGLGLAIVYSLVTAMGGTVQAESKKGAGSRFTVILPLVRDEKTYPLPPSVERHTRSFAGKRILLAEDNYINQQVAIQLLSKKFAITCEVAPDGQTAVEMFSAAAAGYYDMILMDIKMPVMDGLEATRHIRELPRPDAKSIPIIGFSANAFEEDVALSIKAGMNGHLVKPIDIAALSMVLEKNLK